MKKVSLFLAALVTVLGSMLFVAQPASAFIMDGCTSNAEEWNMGGLNQWKNPTGTAGTDDIIGRTFTSTDGATSFYGATGYEWFGGNSGLGLTSDKFWDDGEGSPEGRKPSTGAIAVCNGGNTTAVLNSFSGIFMPILWETSLIINGIASSLLEMSQSAGIITWFTDTIIVPFQQGSDTNGDGTGDGGGINQFYIVGISAVIGIGVIYYIILMGRGRAKDFGKQSAWQVVSIGAGVILLANPLFLTGASQWAVEKLGNGLSTMTSQVISNLVTEDTSSEMCLLGDNVAYPDGETITVGETTTRLPSKEVRQVVCQFWQATALAYYREAQFGTRQPIVLTPNADQPASSMTVEIPGLLNGPATGDLVALNLATRNLDPAEQAWLKAKAAANNTTTENSAMQLPLYGGSEALTGVFKDNPAAVYPAADIYANYPEVDATAGQVNGEGHHDRFEALTFGMGQQSQQVFGTYHGGGPTAIPTRGMAIMGLGLTSIGATGGVAIFSILSIMYQLFIGLMVLFLPLALVGMAMPMRWGKQIAKDFFSKIVENILLASLAMTFGVGSLIVTVVIPGLLPWGATNPQITLALSAIGLALMLFLWRKVVKGFRVKVPQVMGANDKTMWDVGSNATSAVGGVAKVAGVAAVGIGAAAMTGGMAGAVIAGKTMAKSTANDAARKASGGKLGNTFNSGKDAGSGVEAVVAKNLADPYETDSLETKLHKRAEEKKKARAEKAGGTYETLHERVEKEQSRAAEEKAARTERRAAHTEKTVSASSEPTPDMKENNKHLAQEIAAATAVAAPTSNLLTPSRPTGQLPTPNRVAHTIQNNETAGYTVKDSRAATRIPEANRATNAASDRGGETTSYAKNEEAGE